MKRLEGRNAVITGCNRGIGKAILEAFAREGCNVVACTRTLSPETEDLYNRLSLENGVKIYPVCFDLQDDESIKRGLKEIYALKLTVDILVNNAGIVNTDGLMRLKMDEARRVMQVNYFAPLLITQWIVKLMLKSKHASIINMCSVTATFPSVGNTIYGASKAALSNSSVCWAKELAALNIRVNNIAPGYIETEMSTSIDFNIMSSFISDTLIKRLGTPEEIASGVVFLASDESKYIDGTTLTISGGFRK